MILLVTPSKGDTYVTKQQQRAGPATIDKEEGGGCLRDASSTIELPAQPQHLEPPPVDVESRSDDRNE